MNSNHAENTHELVLASSSPRRKDIFDTIGIEYTLMEVHIDESNNSGFSPERYAIETARKKALEAAARKPKAIIVAADTVIELKNGEIIGKPATEEDAKMILDKIQGGSHYVITAVAVINPDSKNVFTAYEKTEVMFQSLSDSEIEWYISTGEPMDKAGAFGLQERAMIFIERIEGTPSNVIGLPANLLYNLFQQAGIDILKFIKK